MLRNPGPLLRSIQPTFVSVIVVCRSSGQTNSLILRTEIAILAVGLPAFYIGLSVFWGYGKGSGTSYYAQGQWRPQAHQPLLSATYKAEVRFADWNDDPQHPVRCFATLVSYALLFHTHARVVRVRGATR